MTPLSALYNPATKLGLGLAALGRPGYINIGHGDDLDNTEPAAMLQNAHHVLDAAWQAGIRYYDVARSYGRAEQFLGSWLMVRRIKPADVIVGSKWGYTYTAKWQVDAEVHEVKEHSLKVLNRQWQETRRNLGQHLDLYQIHSATIESGVLSNQDVLIRLSTLKEEGVAIGLSVSGPQQSQVIEKGLSIEIEGQQLFDSVQATWNLLEPSAADILHAAHDLGMVVIIKEALANGRLTSRSASAPDFAEQYKLLQREASRLATTVDALALAAAIAQPWANIVLSGAATLEHLQSNLAAEQVQFDTQALQALIPLVEDRDMYWQKRAELEWN